MKENVNEFGEDYPPGANVAPPEEIQLKSGGNTAIELRGYEVARQLGDRWVQVAAYKGSDAGFKRSRDHAIWLSERHPQETYRLRPIISVPFPDTMPEEVPK